MSAKIISFPNKENVDVIVEGLDSTSLFVSPSQGVPKSAGRLPDEVLKQLYLRTSKVRECVDGIAGEICSRIPSFVINEDEFGKIPQTLYTTTLKLIKNFFRKINRKQDTFRNLLFRIVVDLLVFDRCFIEKVRNSKGQLVELYVRDPSTMFIMKDKHGVFTGFKQVVSGQEITFSTDDIIYLTLHPTSFDDYGIPILEGIVSEVSSFLASSKLITKYLVEDSTPAGLLVLGRIGEEAFNQLKAVLTNPDMRNKIIALRNMEAESVQWVQLEKNVISDDRIDYLIGRLDRIILKAFQIPVDEDLRSKGSAELIYQINQSKLIEPIVTIIEEAFTNYILHQEFNLPFSLKLLRKVDISGNELHDRARAVAQVVNAGILTQNEARIMLGLPTIYGGNVRLGKLGNEYVIFTDTGKVQRLPEFMPVEDNQEKEEGEQ